MYSGSLAPEYNSQIMGPVEVKISLLSFCLETNFWDIGAVHILRQPGEWEGGRQTLTIVDEGGRAGKPNADHC